MSIEKVIEIGKDIVKPDLPWYSEFNWIIWLVIIVSLILGVVFVEWGERNWGVFRQFFGFGLVVLSILIFIGGIAVSSAKEKEIYKQEISKWENEYVKPYIESLPKDKKEIIYIKIDPELSHDVEGQTWWGTGYTRSTAIERTPLVISYKDNGVITRTNWYETYMQLTNEEKPYIEYQYLPQDVGHGIKAGIYNTKIYLPENYTFTDIK